MDRLTREEIESVWSDVYRAYEQHTPNIYPEAVARLRAPFDLALQSLESVRSEALEEAADECKHLALYGPPEYSLAFCQAEEAIRALSPARVAEQTDVHENELRDGKGNQ